MNELSNLKALWHVDRISDLRAGREIVPTHVQLIISDLCNQNCHFCAYRMDGGFATEEFADESGNRNPHRFIPTEKAIEIIDDCSRLGVQGIQFTGGGEPTVHKDWERIIGHAQEHGIETGLVTNGVRLKPCATVENLTWLRISLDAGTPKTYEMIRQSSAWNQAIAAIEYSGTLPNTTTGVGYVITRENWKEISEACEIARDAGVDYIRLSAMFSQNEDSHYEGLEGFIDHRIKKAIELQTPHFKVVNLFDDRIADLQMRSPDYDFCGYQQFTVYIGGNLKVYTCCTNAYTKHGEIGDLREQGFGDWLETTKRTAFNARSCHHCQFNDKNQIINYVMQRKPAHVGFV